jgi:hypothetical protein
MNAPVTRESDADELTTVRPALKQEAANEQFDDVTEPELPLAKLKAALRGRVENDR